MLKLHLAVLLFGLAGVFGKLLLIPATAIVFGRTCIAALFLSGFLLLRRKRIPVSFRSAIVLIPSGVLLALHWLTFFRSIQISSVALGLFSYATFPVLIAFLDPIFSGRKIQKRDLLNACLVLLGLMLVVPSYESADNASWGVFWGLCSAITFALLTLFNSRIVRNCDPMIVGLFQNGWAAVCLCPFGASLLTLTAPELLQVSFLGIFCTAIAHTSFVAALRAIRPQAASVIAALEPVYGIMWAILLLGEYPVGRQIVGGSLIIAVAVLNAIGHNHTPVKPEVVEPL